jgi:hypothetical protein
MLPRQVFVSVFLKSQFYKNIDTKTCARGTSPLSLEIRRISKLGKIKTRRKNV